ncbi:MAG TPA: SMP-30/gluconolactonase/LRE family protein, partial [Flavisolibacter sp.]|nr:SMP-30/gluconolactonase/LRE family protein [Flavisolibacter sp.]
MNAALTVLHSSIEDFINTGFEIETLANDCSFTEGPLWHSSGHYLFSDIPANVIYKIVPGNEKEIYLTNSGTDKPDDEYIRKEQAGSNGLAFDQDGSLIICQHGSHRISKYQNELKPFITEYKGKPFNSPNDLILHSNGKLFFSDPPYGLKDQKLNPEKFQPVAGVYCWSNGDLHLICDKYQYPNGVC